MECIKDKIVQEAKKWIGTRYKHLGRDENGLDCVGLIIKTGHACKLGTYDTLNYTRRPNPQDFLREMKHHLDRVRKDEVEHGDIAVFAEPRHPCHVGIIERDDEGRLWVIHAYAPARKVVREVLEDERLRNLRMAFRYRPGHFAV